MPESHLAFLLKNIELLIGPEPAGVMGEIWEVEQLPCMNK